MDKILEGVPESEKKLIRAFIRKKNELEGLMLAVKPFENTEVYESLMAQYRKVAVEFERWYRERVANHMRERGPVNFFEETVQ